MAQPTPEVEALPEPRWGFSDVAITLLGTMVLGIAVAVVTEPLRRRGGTAEAWSYIVLLVVPWVCLAGWPLHVARTKGNGPRLDFGLTLVDGPMRGLLSRAVIVADRDLTILYTEQVPSINQEPDYDAALAALA